MARSGVTKSATRRLTWLAVLILGIAGLVGMGVATGAPGASFTPKLALDLQGGTSIILSPVVADGQTISKQELEQAVGIIRQRVDSTGVSESQITTSGDNNIVVSIPGTPDDNTLKLIKSSAKLEFRAVLATNTSAVSTVGGDGASASPSAAAKPNVAPTDPSDLNWITPALQAQFDALDCTKQFREPGQVDPADQPLVTCEANSSAKYILGPVEISGEDISNASNGTTTTSTGASTNTWAVNLSFNDEGTKAFAGVTQRLYGLTDPRNRFAVTLDGYVITAPTTQAVITTGDAQITGSFDQVSSKSLADSLKYGALPISFKVQSQENISATLGSEQLSSGLLAGLIGLILVVIYSLFQYRALAIVTIGSLLIAAVITYVVITFLSWRQGFRLSLSGVAGLIVAIGITADSFIVYFERVRDELRDGRPLNAAVESGWKRAFRTILVSDGVNILAAVVLFLLTVGSVQGFAYTIGLTTLVDVAVVMLFTHPMLQLLSQTKFFASGHPWSGFDARSLGASYRGRLEFKTAERVSGTKKAKASKEATKRQTLAERKAAQAEEGN
ncbi:MAG: protein translocase subunit SecD [Actinomycetota bacterium]|jgi:preprotein translocase subunit SecD